MHVVPIFSLASISTIFHKCNTIGSMSLFFKKKKLSVDCRCYRCLHKVDKLFIFLYWSLEPLGQFKSNLAQIIFEERTFKLA